MPRKPLPHPTLPDHATEDQLAAAVEEAARLGTKVFPDGRPLGQSAYIGWTEDSLPIPRPRPKPHRGVLRPHRTDEYRARRAAKSRHRKYQRMKMLRPHWWSPKGVIERLENGDRLPEILEACMADGGNKIKLRALYYELGQWKAQLPAFKADFDRAVKLYPHRTLQPRHWGLFFRAMEECDGKVEHVCARLRIGQKVIYGMLDPALKDTYDKEFAAKFRHAETERIARIRTQYLHQAEQKDNAKIQQAIVEAGLPHLHGRKKTVAVEGGINLQLESAALDQQVARSKALLSGRASEPKQLPAAAPMIEILTNTAQPVLAELIKDEF